jgi:hypothetical protein
VDRAVAVRPDFTLTDANCAAVCTICRRLDGMPLAIELAAARMRGLPVEQIADRLDDRFRLLTGGSRTVLPRHRTLRAAIDWSWDLLTGPERELASRLSMFIDGTTLDAVQQVGGGDALDTLTSLVDKSLVDRDGDRYRMQESIRAYASELLGPERESAFRAFTDYYIDFAEEAEPALRTHAQADWLARLAAEHCNSIAALGWAVETGDVARSVRLLGGLTWYWLLRGLRADVLVWRRRVLDLVSDGPPTGLAAAYLVCTYAEELPQYLVQWWGQHIGEPEVFRRLVRRAMAEEHPPHPVFVILLAGLEYREGKPGLLDECVRSADPWLAGNALLLRGVDRLNRGLWDAASADFNAAVAGLRLVEEPRGLSRALLTLATLRTRMAGVETARPLLDEASALITPWVGANEAVLVDTWYAHLLIWDGENTEGGTKIAEARSRITEDVSPATLAWLRVVEADLARRTGNPGRAVSLYHEVLDDPGGPVLHLERPADGSTAVAEIWGRTSCAIAHLELGDHKQAERELADALSAVSASGSLSLLLVVAVGYALAALATGEPERAATILGACWGLFPMAGGPDTRTAVAAARAALGDDVYERVASRGRALTADRLLALLAD